MLSARDLFSIPSSYHPVDTSDESKPCHLKAFVRHLKFLNNMLIHFVLFASSVAQTLLGTANIHGKPIKEQLPNTGDNSNTKKSVSCNTNSIHLCQLMN